MNMDFAKIFKVENSQVLVTTEFENDEDDVEVYKMTLRTDFEGMEAKISMGFLNEEQRNIAFKKYSLKEANKFREDMKQFFNDNNQ